MFVLANMWFQKLMIQFFFNIDKIVYNFISTIYNLLISIARTSIFSQADIAEFADRIYKLLAVFMIFKVTFSLIMYIVNPDDFSDKSKGISKLGTNIIITLCLLVITPYIFNYAYELQTIILEENTLAKIIFGDESDSNYLNDAGDEMAYIAMGPFFSPNTSLKKLYECNNLVIKDTDGKVKFNPDCSGLENDENLTSLNDGDSLMALTGDNFSETTLKDYVTGVNNSNFGLMFRDNLALATYEDSFIMDYKYIFSTIVGVMIILLLLTFCMDIAVRSIKLSFLQLIAPIPIISYVDPKSGKDGMFKNWYKMCFSTYLSLFLRLLALYFAIYIISKVADMKMYDLIDGSYQTSKIVAIFIIIGALMFAKQLPKILEGLGIKLDGNGFTLNPLRKIEKEALGGNLLKKPNDMLAKAGKGIMKAPFSAASLGARKFMAGVDSKRNGQGFWNGTKNVKGKLGQSIDKFREKNMPLSYKRAQDKKSGEAEVQAMHSKWSDGKKKADKLQSYAKKNGKDPSKPFDVLNGQDAAAYDQVYKNKEFAKSRMALDAKENERKVLQRISDATMRGVSISDAIKAEKAAIGAIGGKFEQDLLTGPNAMVNQNTGVATARLTKSLDDTTKAVSGMEKVHESIRKQNPNDAATEDELKFVKYNDIDPTDPSRVASKDWTSNSEVSDEEDDYEEPEGISEEIPEESPSNAGQFEKEQLRVQIENLQRELSEEKKKLESEKNKIQNLINTLNNQKEANSNYTYRKYLETEIMKYETDIIKIDAQIEQLVSEYESQISEAEARINELS